MTLFNFFKKKILVVEDDSALRKVLCEKIRQEGWEVLEAADGRDGLSSAVKNHPDVILLDLMLPQMDGLMLLEELRKDDWGKEAKVIIISNLMPGTGLMDKARIYNVADYIEKADISLIALTEKIKKLL